MTASFLRRLQAWIAAGNAHRFYLTPEWKAVSVEVLRLDRGECQIHKERGRYKRAELVHHEMHLKMHPELALDIYYTDIDGTRKRNLRSVCRWCHENVCHPGRLKPREPTAKAGFTTEERWD